MSKKVGVVLSGCGVMDGAEVHESVLTLLALDRAEATMVFMAPDIDQMHVVNHMTGEPEEGAAPRNVRVESARIARGEVMDIAQARADQFDALIFPGGFGAAKNLSDFAVKGGDCTVHPEVERLIRETHAAGKPIGLACISPVLAARVLGDKGVSVTIGTSEDVAKAIGSFGARHVNCPVREITVDRENKVVTTPAYMLARRISEAADGIQAMVDRVLEMA